jgi:CubicO group peptidase (beta-lactamase class C family)
LEAAELALAVERFVPHLLAATGVPGLAVTVMHRDGGTLLTGGWGVTDLDTQTPMTADALWPVASMTKPVVAVAALQLEESGLLGLHDSIEPLVPFPVRNPYGQRPITPYDILTHATGLHTDGTYTHLDPNPQSLGGFLASVFEGDRAREYPESPGPLWVGPVGECYRYSSLAIALLAYACEVVAGVPFEDHARAHIFEPLGMTSSRIPAQAIPPAGTPGYMRLGNWCVPSPALYTSIPPSAGMQTTMPDYTRFLVALMNGGTTQAGGRVLTRASARQILSPQLTGQFPGAEARTLGLTTEMSNLGRPDFWAGQASQYPLGWVGMSRVYPALDLAVTACQNSWDIVRYALPENRSAVGLVCDFIASLAGGLIASPPDRGYQHAYGHGLLVADRLAMIGAGTLSPEQIAAMISGTRPLPARPNDWEADAFEHGIRAASAHPAPAAFRSFLSSDACEVARPYLDLVALQAGASRAAWPVPMPFFADRQEGDQGSGAHLDAMPH